MLKRMRAPRRRGLQLIVGCTFAAAMLAGRRAEAVDTLCDSAYENCRTKLIAYINQEPAGGEIDVGMWFMEDSRYATALISRMNAGVKVRILMDPRANDGHPDNEAVLNQLYNANVPMRRRTTSAIEHWKAMIFNAQNIVYFGSANFSGDAFVNVTPYVNYVDETVYITDTSTVVNSFRRKFDDAWVDTASYTNYRNAASPVRGYPALDGYAVDPELNFPPGSGQDFGSRSVKAYNAEPVSGGIDSLMFRITDRRHTDAIIAARTRGVPVRMIVDPTEYRNTARVWDSWNVDRLYMAGVDLRITTHQGINHGKLTILRGQHTTVFGSSNWTSPSANAQHEHNYFTKRSLLYDYFIDYFNWRWNNACPTVQQAVNCTPSAVANTTRPFAPLPPDKPVYDAIANGKVGVPTTGVKLVWNGGQWAHLYDVYLGTDPANLALFAANLDLGPSEYSNMRESYTLPTLNAGTTYYWKIVSKTMALVAKEGPVWSFTTAGTQEGPPPGVTDVVLWASNIPPSSLHGNWTRVADSSAAGGVSLHNPDRGQAKVAPALASPTNYVDATFNATAGVAYHLWIRMAAENNSTSNDSLHVQFSDAVDALGSSVGKVDTSASVEIVLQEGSSGAAPHGYGWADNGWGTFGTNIYFKTTGSHLIRIQQREDGAVFDQIVLSPDPNTYRESPPGPLRDDTTILPAAGAGDPPPPPPPPPTLSADTVVLHMAEVPTAQITGNWQVLADSTAAGGSALWNPNTGAAKVAPALASPANYFEAWFDAKPGTPYHVWVRMKAESNSLSNDSVHIQFGDSLAMNGSPFAQLDSTSSMEFVLQNGSNGPADHGWGWTENGWGSFGANIQFATAGPHRLRVQQREDGAILDQIVISPDTYLNATPPPGSRQDDTTILPSQGTVTP
jgi:hypothetical protein